MLESKESHDKRALTQMNDDRSLSKESNTGGITYQGGESQKTENKDPLDVHIDLKTYSATPAPESNYNCRPKSTILPKRYTPG